LLVLATLALLVVIPPLLVDAQAKHVRSHARSQRHDPPKIVRSPRDSRLPL
jgi:hypothetical protein